MRKLKRILACLLAITVLTAASVPATATSAEDQVLRYQIPAHYSAALAGSGKASLGGYCGLMTSWQLYLMGVNTSLLTNDGNRQYDYYRDMEYTTGGHRVKAYSAEHYTLKEALYAATGYGTRDAYNLVVGFQWTNTAAGATYGHAVVVYAILDGMVYFTEGFSTSLGSAEGQAIVITIDEFVRYYSDWTRFEGVIEFGIKDLAYASNHYAADCFCAPIDDIDMYHQPTTDPAEGLFVRTVRAGEHVYVTGIYEGAEGRWFYQVREESGVGYIPVEIVEMLTLRQIVPTDLQAQLPERVEKGSAPDMQISLALPEACTADLVLYDARGQALTTVPMENKDQQFRASGDVLGIAGLAEGAYRVCVVASREQTVMFGEDPVTSTQQETVLTLSLCVGQEAQPLQEAAPAPFADGWNYRNDTWYYYKDGAPFVGWLCDGGRDYYLKADGSITTGWVEILGKPRYFTNAGVMRTGWMEDDGNTYYLMCNGVPAQGWRQIDGNRYYFDHDGAMVRNAWLEDENESYYLQMDGALLITD